MRSNRLGVRSDRALQHAGAEHRHEGQRDDAGKHDRDRERDGKLTEQTADHAAHEQQGNEHRDQRHASARGR